MIRGTTSLNVFHTNRDLRGAKIYITYMQNNRTVVEKSNDSMTIEENRIAVRLRQDEMLRFSKNPRSKVQMQIRYITPNGEASASNIMETTVNNVLKEGVITYA